MNSTKSGSYTPEKLHTQLIRREIQIIDSRKKIIDTARKFAEQIEEARSRSCGTWSLENWAWDNIYATIDENGGADFLGTDLCDLVQPIICGGE